MAKRRLKAVACTSALLLASAVLTASPASAAPETITVSGTQSGTSTQFIGANEGQTDFDIADLQDAGVTAYRFFTSMGRTEWEDDDGVYGSPSISQIKANPNVVNWEWWDDAMTSSSPQPWPTDLASMLADLKDADIAPVIVLRNTGTTWAPNPPTTQNDWNEWWEHVFALAYWLNVRNDFQVDHYQALNEPNHPGQGWYPNTSAEYFELVEVTKDALDHVYDTYLPGRSHELHAPVSAGNPPAWVQGALQQIPDAFTTVDTHTYATDVTSNIETVRGWMDDAEEADKELWISEWGSLNDNYGDTEVAVDRVLNNMIGMSTSASRVDGSLIFKMYDPIPNFGCCEGLIDVNGNPRKSYYAFRMGTRALNGGKPTYEASTSHGNLKAIATRDEGGNIYLLVTNTGGTHDVDADLSALMTSGTGTMWRFNSTTDDEVVGNPTLSNGHVNFTMSGYGAVLIRFHEHAAVADAYVRGGEFADDNFGTVDTLVHKTWPQEDYTRWSYLKFDLTDVNPTAVDEVRLRVFATCGVTAECTEGSIDTSVFSVSNTSWSETGITWNNKPATSGTALDTVTAEGLAGAWYELDVTSYVQSELAADHEIISLAFKNPDQSSSLVGISSRDEGENVPHLRIITDPVLPQADAYVRDGSFASDNFGTEDKLHHKTWTQEDWTRWSYLKFDLSGIDPGEVQQVALRVFASAIEEIDTSVYSVANTSWTETGITWNNKPATGGVALDTISVASGGLWYELDVTSYVQAELAAERSTVSLALKNDAAPAVIDQLVKVNSREASENKPNLRVVIE